MTPLPDPQKAAAKTLVVDIGDLKVSREPDAMIVTYGLGSCIAVIAYDPIRKIGGMLHYMLPVSTVALDKAKKKPAMFGDTGIPLLFESLYELGTNKQDLIVRVAGGASLNDDRGIFNIGPRNYAILQKLFAKNNVHVSAEDVGGKRSRTARLWLNNGRVTIRSENGEEEL